VSGDAVAQLVINAVVYYWIEKPIDPWRGWRLLEAVLFAGLVNRCCQ